MATAATAYYTPHTMHGLMSGPSSAGTSASGSQTRVQPRISPSATISKPPAAKAIPGSNAKPAARKFAPAGGVPLLPAKSTSARPLRPLLAAAPVKAAPGKPVLQGRALSTTSQHKPPHIQPAQAAAASTSGNVERASKPAASSADYFGRTTSDSASTQQSSPASIQSPSTSSSSTLDAETASSVKKEDLTAKHDWVLPARAKPGRKPSDVEPPTKRKAQNRASQRAFRERRQSYLASLEDKVAEYEKKGVGVSQEIQRVARRLKDENAALRGENSKLKARIAELEAHSVERSVDNRTSPKSSAPASKRDVGGDCGFCTRDECICIGEGVLDFREEDEDASSDKAPASLASPAQRRPITTPARLALPLKRSVGGDHAKVWHTVPSPSPQQASYDKAHTQAAHASIQICPTVSRHRWSVFHPMARHLPPFTAASPGSTRQHDSSLRLPSITGQQSKNIASLPRPDVSKPRKTIWPVYPASSRPQSSRTDGSVLLTRQSQARVFRMRRRGEQMSTDGKALACSGDPDNCSACSSDPALAEFCKAVSAHLVDYAGDHHGPVILDTGNAIPLRRTRHGASQSLDPASGIDLTKHLGKRPRSGTLSSGEPLASLYTNSTGYCPSQGQRPPLWKVASDNGTHQASQHSLMAPAVSNATRPSLPPLVRMPTIESIPDAWRRIKQHPSFETWQEQQGGLDLLADVVARRESESSTETSPQVLPAAPHRRVRIAESGARGVDDDANSDTTTTRAHVEIDEEDDSFAASKRRRLYVERKSVDNVLAMMDQARTGKTSTQSPSSEDPDEGTACACPLSKLMSE